MGDAVAPDNSPERFPIFLSHASADAGAAEALARWLRLAFGTHVFVSTILPGERWDDIIRQSLENCALGLVLVTENSLERPWVHFEVGFLLARKKTIITVCTEGVRPADLPPMLSGIQVVEWSRAGDPGRLIDAVALKVGVPAAHEVANEPPPLISGPDRSPPRALGERRYSTSAIVKMIEGARREGRELRVTGVANTEFFGTASDDVGKCLTDSLKATPPLRARFIFLDPKSPAAARRDDMADPQSTTIATIEGGLKRAAELVQRYRGLLALRLVQEMPCFLCLDGRRVLYHPYFLSISGSAAVIWQAGESIFERTVEHFEKLWGPRWVLLDKRCESRLPDLQTTCAARGLKAASYAETGKRGTPSLKASDPADDHVSGDLKATRADPGFFREVARRTGRPVEDLLLVDAAGDGKLQVRRGCDPEPVSLGARTLASHLDSIYWR